MSPSTRRVTGTLSASRWKARQNFISIAALPFTPTADFS
jgi:hypothetical protein